ADRGVGLAEYALLVDDERVPGGEFSALGPVGLGDLALGVAQEGEGQCVLLDELLLGVQVVKADADDHGVQTSELLVEVAEAASLGRSAAGEGLGVEPQDDVLALEVLD